MHRDSVHNLVVLLIREAADLAVSAGDRAKATPVNQRLGGCVLAERQQTPVQLIMVVLMTKGQNERAEGARETKERRRMMISYDPLFLFLF